MSSSVHAPQVAWPLQWPRPPSPSCLVGLGGVGVVVVGVAWVALGSDFSTTNSFVGVCKGLRLAGVIIWGDRRQCKTDARSHRRDRVVGASSRLDAEYSAVRQDKGHRFTGPWKGGVVEAASPLAGAMPKSDLYAGDAKDLSAMVGAPDLTGRQINGSPFCQGRRPEISWRDGVVEGRVALGGCYTKG